MKFFIPLFFALIIQPLSAQTILGDWYGNLEFGSTQLGIVFHISQEGEAFTATMDSPDQMAFGLPADKTTFVDGELYLEMVNIKMNYRGKLNAAGDAIEGTFTQGGSDINLVMKRKAEEKRPMFRPQEPKDFPYYVEEVTFRNEKDQITLAGTLTMPSADKKADQLVILISGSGGQNRDEELNGMGHKPFLVLSDHFTRQGIAVLRFDDRGIAESEGDHSTATSLDFSYDVEAALDYVLQRKDLQVQKIGLVGHSEGGMIAPMVASRRSEINFITLMAGPGILINDLLYLQSKAIGSAEGMPEEIFEANQKILAKAYAEIGRQPDATTETLKPAIEQIFKEGLAAFPDSLKADIDDIDSFVSDEADQLLSPWFRFFVNYNPADYLKKVSCPILAINGDKDLQVTVPENTDGIRQALTEVGHPNFEVLVLKDLNHLFQQASTGAPSEYSKIEETINEVALKIMSDWIGKQ